MLTEAPGAIECRVATIIEPGDHHIVVGEVGEVHLDQPISGRPDKAILEMKDLGDDVFHGGWDGLAPRAGSRALLRPPGLATAAAAAIPSRRGASRRRT